MPAALQDERNQISPRLLRLDSLSSYIRGNTAHYKSFPSQDWFTPSRMAVIHKRIVKARAHAIAKVGSVTPDAAMEIENYYLHLLSSYQFLSFGGEIGPDPQRMSKRHKTAVHPRSLQDWHKLLDFLSDRMFYWSNQHRLDIAQVESMTRIWLLVWYYHKN